MGADSVGPTEGDSPTRWGCEEVAAAELLRHGRYHPCLSNGSGTGTGAASRSGLGSHPPIAATAGEFRSGGVANGERRRRPQALASRPATRGWEKNDVRKQGLGGGEVGE
ncbi:hypothetical protein VPH35_060259 [Triticum aestivum]|uniref:Uncharacterized protein n=1 Tax=Aegilops tauschii subsp. strangulata TaxID=200361 RepID=A0A453F796_AEGTS